MEIGRLDARFGVEVTGLDLSRPLAQRFPVALLKQPETAPPLRSRGPSPRA